ncbi:MAG TPA: hypothetical protein VFJ72_12305 [Rubrobacteraceae bacterium]|nr:hypothetical protein [Rubrobacteraceae bacterium]
MSFYEFRDGDTSMGAGRIGSTGWRSSIQDAERLRYLPEKEE